jgi:hypothetical protein
MRFGFLRLFCYFNLNFIILVNFCWFTSRLLVVVVVVVGSNREDSKVDIIYPV